MKKKSAPRINLSITPAQAETLWRFIDGELNAGDIPSVVIQRLRQVRDQILREIRKP